MLALLFALINMLPSVCIWNHKDDPDVPLSQHHRNYLRDHVAFKEPIPIKDPLVLSKIHQTYRIGYLKDFVLTKEDDDDDDGTWEDTSAKLKSVIKANMATIATLLQNDSNFIQELFARLRSPSTSVESRNNLAHFLLEFCSLCKSLETEQKLLFTGELASKGIFDVIAEVLQSPDKKLVLTGTDILCTLFKEDDTLLRSDAVRPGSPLFDHLVKGLMEDFGEKMQYQFVDIIRNVLESTGDERRVMMGRFCERHIPALVDCITASCPGNTSEGASTRVGSHRGVKPDVILTICDVLCVCVGEDASRRSFFHTNLTEKVLCLTRRKEKHVVAAAIRFLRTVLAVHDDDVHSDIVENNVLEPVIDVFVANGHRDNMLTSTILELLDHISKGKIPVLLKYIVDTFWDQLGRFEHLPTIQRFKKKYDESFRGRGTRSTTDPADTRGKGIALDEKGSADASSASPSKRFRGLVDYDDDKEDDADEDDPSKKPRVSPTSEAGNKNSP